jgi:hypothetical protein
MLRVLAQDVWYEVRTSVNDSEPLFWSQPNRDLLRQVFYEAREIYVFELRGLRFAGSEVSFYIKPDDGFLLPAIMQWIKQTFATRFNVVDGRSGHIWGDRYWSLILPGKPPEWAEVYVFVPVVCGGRKAWRYMGAGSVGGGWRRGGAAGSPARDAKVCPSRGKRAQNTRLPPDLPRRTATSRG